jgi:hypothetical protein
MVFHACAINEELVESVAIVGQTTFWRDVLHAQNYGINPINLRKNSKQLGNTYQKSDDDIIMMLSFKNKNGRDPSYS